MLIQCNVLCCCTLLELYITTIVAHLIPLKNKIIDSHHMLLLIVVVIVIVIAIATVILTAIAIVIVILIQIYYNYDSGFNLFR